MYVFIGTKIALAGYQIPPEDTFYYWVDNEMNFFVDKDGNYFIHNITETEVTE